jgi:CheY-like chemotaxis protein
VGLVVSNAAVRAVLAEQLENWGAEVLHLVSDQDVLLRLARGFRADLLLIDASGGDINSKAIAHELRARDLEVPIFALAERGHRSRVESLGMKMITKPLQIRDLHGALLELYGSAMGEDEPPSAPMVESASSESREIHIDPNRTRVLVAEDNVVNQKVAQRMLTKLGWASDVVGDGKEAIEAIRTGKYGLVLMDVQMPELDGLEASAMIRRGEAGGEQPTIIAMTANSMEGDRERCIEAGMDDYIPKPVSIDRLRELLESLEQPTE